MEKSQQISPEDQLESQTAKTRPDETGTVQVDAFVRIYDPESNETFLETRA